MAFKVYMTNFFYDLEDELPSEEEAIRRGRQTGFDFTVYESRSGVGIRTCGDYSQATGSYVRYGSQS